MSSSSYKPLPSSQETWDGASTVASRRRVSWRSVALFVVVFAQRTQYELSLGTLKYFGSNGFATMTSRRRRDLVLRDHEREAITSAYTTLVYGLPLALACLRWRHAPGWKLRSIERTGRACVLGGMLAALATIPARVSVELFLCALFLLLTQSVTMLVVVYVAAAERYDATNAEARTRLWLALYLALNLGGCCGIVISTVADASPSEAVCRWALPTAHVLASLVLWSALRAVCRETDPSASSARRSGEDPPAAAAAEEKPPEDEDIEDVEQPARRSITGPAAPTNAAALTSQARRIGSVLLHAARRRPACVLPAAAIGASFVGFACNALAWAAFSRGYDDGCSNLLCHSGTLSTLSFGLAVTSCGILTAAALVLGRSHRSAGYLEACKKQHGGPFEEKDVERAKDALLLSPLVGFCVLYVALYWYAVGVFRNDADDDADDDDMGGIPSAIARSLIESYDAVVIVAAIPVAFFLSAAVEDPGVRPLPKLVISSALLAASLAASAAAATTSGRRWIVCLPRALLLGASEIFGVPTFYELFYAEVPPELRATSMSLYMYALAAGHGLGSTARLVAMDDVRRSYSAFVCTVVVAAVWWMEAGTSYIYRQERDWTIAQRRRLPRRQEEERTEGDEIVAVLRGLFSGLEAHYLIPFSLLKMGRVVASGGSGQIYEGRYAGAPVAIKSLYSQMMDPDYVSEVRHEARMLAAVRHPHVTQFHGISRFESRLLLVTEFVPVSLDALVKTAQRKARQYRDKNKRRTTSASSEPDDDVGRSINFAAPAPRPDKFGVEDARRLWVELAQTLIYLHSTGMAHRDIKPSNMLLEEGRDRRYHLKLCDLGMARFSPLYDRAQNYVTLGGGTPAYSPPESYLTPRRRRFSASIRDWTKWDVFSFATVIWYTWHCDDPFPGLSIPEVCMAVSRGDRPRFDSEPPPKLKALVSDMWKQRPAERPTANDILDVLQDDDLARDILRIARAHAAGTFDSTVLLSY
ncbi:hypothetical protein CTAYLR_007597 [Chrysophaeum taylorii]|uniref:Protein kinase domain-containing protein n=1 Tax=Chrysophaeum taylorii TaxID=2483200 RepID=A0AAD7U877_9STRA|nr:hypothetical protein CTAYLR_007597 [Chrysophaeum taylorii]